MQLLRFSPQDTIKQASYNLLRWLALTEMISGVQMKQLKEASDLV